jgi:hypothetical protein
MSNGGFDNIHQRLLAALEPGPAQGCTHGNREPLH